MLRDVFYYGKKPNVHPREKFASSLEDARQQSSTEHFWIINEFCDYRDFDWDFDFEFLPDEDVWAEEHNNVWPSQHQKDSGTWLCNTDNENALTIYRADVGPVKRKNEQSDAWVIRDTIDKTKFDFSWHPDPTDPLFIYAWGTKYLPVEFLTAIEYHLEGATQYKYMSSTVEVLPQWDNWNIPDDVDKTSFDFAWRPDPGSPPYIYVWGNQWNKAEDKAAITYTVPGATEYQYMAEHVNRLPVLDNWEVPDNINIIEFDFSWEPSPAEPPFIYEFGTQWQKTGGPRYIVEGAIETKYVDTLKAKALVNMSNWVVPDNLDISTFDFSWHPDVSEPAYNYQFGTQWATTHGPKYIVEGATEIKYVDFPKATAIASIEKWIVPDNIDINSFDFSWHPDIEDQPYIYQFGTQHQRTGGPKYIAPGIVILSNGKPIGPTKYIGVQKATALPRPDKFSTIGNIKLESFDYSWHPDELEEDQNYVYLFGNTQYPPEIMPTVKYANKGAETVKYVNEIVASLAIDKTNWILPENIDTSEFDFSWKPNPKDPPFIYQFGTQWQKTNGPKYIVEGATEIKYVEENRAKAIEVSRKHWEIPEGLDISEFDFSWHPDATEKPYIYIFGTQWALTGGPKFIPPGATEVKYVDSPVAKAAPNRRNWVIPDDIVVEEFDFSWHPYAEDEPYVYQFGTQWQKTGGPKYIAPGADDTSFVKYIDTRVLKAKRLPKKENWEVPTNIDTLSFDFSWHPDGTEQPFIYQFGTQWQKTGGPKYVSLVATETKYVDTNKAKILSSKTNWIIPEGIEVDTFDFSWHPDATAPNYIYQFGTLANQNDGPRYQPEDNNGEVMYLERTEIKEEKFPQYFIETTLDDLVAKHPKEIFWALNPDLDYGEFDFNWRPDIEQAMYVHAFGSKDNMNTQTYFVNGFTYSEGKKDINYVQDKVLEVKTNIDMFFVDKGNSESLDRFERLKQQFPTIQKTRYLNSWVDTINRCINRASSNLCWILNSELDYANFDFNYYPNPWQMKMVHVFGTQWSHWGTTFMVNRESFASDTKYVKIIEHLSNLNFVKDRRAVATNVIYDVVYIDHGNLDHVPGTTIVKYEESYLKTFKNMLATLPNKKEHYVWVCSSICDYEGFDFTYICDPFAREQLHVFPSDKQKFGDTFLVNVNKLRELINDVTELEEFKVNYNQHQRVRRLPAPTIITEGDTHVSTIHTDFDWPYATLVTNDNKEIKVVDVEPMSLWTIESKAIQITSVGGTRIVVPKEAKDYIKRELYDYPYIQTNKTLAKSTPMDIVFLSNGETGADENYEHLLNVTKGLPNRVVRVDGVNGRVQAYHASALASNTPWAFTVFAKLKVSNKFDWNWQPDRLQIPKHYVFHAKNPVNGLVYGHQAMIAYNKKLTLANEGKGLDFTMDDEHEIVEILSGTANFNTDEYSTWRTSFREALKLRANTDDVSKNRLEFWLTVGSGKFSQYSIDGASDAVQYYEEVNGDFEQLKLSYEWKWLRAFYESKYK